MGLCWSQRDALAQQSIEYAATSQRFLDYFLSRLTSKPLSDERRSALLAYIENNEGAPWTGSAEQIQIKAPGLTRLILGLGEYQLI
jgi:hypothetical protein